MKKIYLLTVLLLGVFSFISCSKDESNGQDDNSNSSDITGVWSLTREESYNKNKKTGSESNREVVYDAQKAKYGSQILDISKETKDLYTAVWYEYQIKWEKSNHKISIKNNVFNSSSSLWMNVRVISVTDTTIVLREKGSDQDYEYEYKYTFTRIEKVPNYSLVA